MKLSYPLCLLSVFLFSCQKEVTEPKEALPISAVWKFSMYINVNRDTITSSNPCWADNTFVIRDGGTATLSQGDCLAIPDKPKEETFQWRQISDSLVDFGGDTVKVTKLTNTEFHFERVRNYLKYHWKK
jgi:hypothetical protein